MRLPGDSQINRFPSSLKLGVGLTLASLIGGCGVIGGKGQAPAVVSAPAANGPAADYPVVIGDPYFVDGVEYTPVDTMNYDEVGALQIDADGGAEVSGAHRTLPLPSYVEVTSLETGRTILVRLEHRGPMTGAGVVGLSEGALAQLGADVGTPVRVRRVNPPEAERRLLRSGEHAPLRMDTPMSLVQVLRRRLPDSGSASLARDASPPVAEEAPELAAIVDTTSLEADTSPLEIELPPSQMAQVDAEPVVEPAEVQPIEEPVEVAQVEEPTPEPAAAPVPQATGEYVVQAGAFSTEDRASNVADAIEGSVSRSGKFYRVRTGPFETRSQAEASLAKVQAAGYKDARIFKSG